MIPELTGFYIHLPDSMPDVALENLERCLQNLNEFRSRISEKHSTVRLQNDRVVMRKHRALGPVENDLNVQVLELPDDPYDALKSLLAKEELPVDDLNSRMETMAYFHGLFPLLDLELSLDLLGRHAEFLSSYTYAENVPPGMTPDYVASEFFELDKRPEGDIRSFVFKNFHELDAEVAFYQPDLRIHRLQLNSLDHRSVKTEQSISRGLHKCGLPQSLTGLRDLIHQQPEVIRIGPSYLEVELCSDSPVKDKLQLPAGEGRLSQDQRNSILKGLDQCIQRDVTICLGGLGDSGSDSDAPQFALDLLQHMAVKQVIVETYGYDLQSWIHYLSGNAERAGQVDTKRRLSFIVRLCSLRSDRYEHFYSGGDLNRLLAELDAVSDFLKAGKGPGFSIFLEMQKIQEVEDEIHEFFQKYDPTVFTPILRKQNTYAGALEDRKVADLTPPIRGFCWHLARDLYINSSGEIPVCRQVPDGGSAPLDIEQAFRENEQNYLHSMKGQHSKIPAPCLQCDEWYLFQG
ncbi:MAG: hypothetical protein CMF59_06655 [Leptospiraceae bacterium]|nr:hypothetical protein [Leptospiraceae bacterium]